MVVSFETNSLGNCFLQYGLGKLLQSIADKDADKISIRLANALEEISELEIIQV